MTIEYDTRQGWKAAAAATNDITTLCYEAAVEGHAKWSLEAFKP